MDQTKITVQLVRMTTSDPIAAEIPAACPECGSRFDYSGNLREDQMIAAVQDAVVVDGEFEYPSIAELIPDVSHVTGYRCTCGHELVSTETDTPPSIAQKLVDLSAWLDRTHGSFEVSRFFGKWQAHLGWKHLHSYSDTDGEHATHWSITRTGEDLWTVIDGLLAAAARSPGQRVGVPVADRPVRVAHGEMICTEGAPCLFHREGGDIATKCPGYCEIGGCRDEEVAEIPDEETGETTGVCHAHAAEYHRIKAGL